MLMVCFEGMVIFAKAWEFAVVKEEGNLSALFVPHLPGRVDNDCRRYVNLLATHTIDSVLHQFVTLVVSVYPRVKSLPPYHQHHLLSNTTKKTSIEASFDLIDNCY